MRSQLFGLLVVFAIGCGGGGSSDKPDAKVFMDAPMPDAPTALTQLGKPCVLAMQGADCPSGATDGCLGPFVMGGTMGICTKICVTNGTFKTDNSNPPMATMIMPADLTAQNAVCVGAYAGPTASPSCTPGSGGVIFNTQPADNPLQPNKNYTFQIACGLGCSAAAPACPGGLTCDTTRNFCHP